MFRKLSLVALLATTLLVIPVMAQEPGFKPAVVQEQMDDATLVDKASILMGYTMLKSIQQQGGVVDMPEMEAGLKAAIDGVDQSSFMAGYEVGLKIKRAGKDINMDEVMAGIKSAQAGQDKKSYFSGYQMMNQMKSAGGDLKLEKLVEGMNLAIAGKEVGMSQEEMTAVQTAFGKMVEKKQVEKMKAESEKNIAATKAFMAKAKAENPNVKQLENGVQYEILVDGDGPKPSAEDKVKVDYHGTFLNGTVFDSSVKPPRGNAPRPIEMVVAQFVPGFSSVLQNMKVGSKWKVVIPGQLAYGPKGDDRAGIGPNQALMFELTLHEILKK